MSNLAKKTVAIRSLDLPALSTAVVVINEDECVLQDETCQFTAEVVESCLLTPMIGDRVLVANSENSDERYVLAIVKRADKSVAKLELDGDVQLAAKSGELKLKGEHGVSIVSPKLINFVSEMLGATATQCEMVFPSLTLASHRLQANFSRVKLFADDVNNRVNRSISLFQSRATTVKGMDQLNAGSLKQAARNMLSLSAKFSFLSAVKNVKIDGKQILMG